MLAAVSQSGQQCSITALTDSSGTMKERYAYDAYGNLLVFDGSGTARTATAEGNRLFYTGREWEKKLGLYHYRARMYDALCGRFLSRDPIGFMEGIHTLAKSPKSPVIFTDPFGLLDPVTMTTVGSGGNHGCDWGRFYNWIWCCVDWWRDSWYRCDQPGKCNHRSRCAYRWLPAGHRFAVKHGAVHPRTSCSGKLGLTTPFPFFSLESTSRH